MIITVTLNPALDKTAELGELKPGELNRLKNVITDVGGKGVNVSKMIAALGGRSIATGFVGGGSGEQIVKALETMGITPDFVRANGVTRTNLKVLDSGSRLTELNEPGITVSAEEAGLLEKKLSGYANKDAIFVLAGSLCQGVGPDFYARLISMMHKSGAKAFLDADGASFKEALKSEEKPDFIKPNLHELKEYFGVFKDLSLSEIRDLCFRFVDLGIPRLILSMGKDGAMFINGKEALYAKGLKVKAHSAVGAGDSMMGAAAYALDAKLDWEKASALSLAASAGAVATIGTKPPSRETVDELLKEVELEALS
ncbi:MAG: 1-phosphofructokinase family hexose kinase [Clostridiales bacterium]|jgi:1-phosphofructokinase|nr:1-phosphofructokinase family hexose kinase [Clostridiales bacterium]